MTENNFTSSYTSFTPLTPETKSITSGFSFTRLFDFPWRREKKGLFGQAVAEETGKEGILEGSDKQIHQNQIPDITISSEKKNENGEEVNSGVITNGAQIGYGKQRLSNTSLNLPRKEKGRYRNVKTILRRLSAIAVDKKWRQVL